MSRPSTTAAAALVLLAAIAFSGCRTVYTDMYRPRKSYFKPVKDQPKPDEVLPPSVETPVETTTPVQPVEPPPAVPEAAPPPEAPPAIPGL
jgi:hypothetical protein